MLSSEESRRRKNVRVLALGLCAIASPLLIMLAFPPYSLSMLEWIALAPALWLAKRARGWDALFLAASSVLYAILLYGWLSVFHPLAIPLVVALFGLVFFFLPLLAGGALLRASELWGSLATACLWVFCEFLRTKGPLPFGFGILGYGQFAFTPFIQIADMTGVFGPSFLVFLVNAAVAALGEEFLARRGGARRLSRGAVALSGAALLLVVADLAYGALRLGEKQAPLGFRVAIAQFDHPPKRSWAAERDFYVDELEIMAGVEPRESVDLVVFPEGSVGAKVSLDLRKQPPGGTELMNRLSGIAKRWGRAALFNALESDSSGPSPREFNSCFLFDRDGNLAGRYRKVLLAPLGEEFPFKRLFKGVDDYILAKTDAVRLARAEKPLALPVASREGVGRRCGVLICYEATDGNWTRAYGGLGADFLVNVSSDRWTGDLGALVQHGSFGVFRAVENRLSLVRAGNGGLSYVADSRGVLLTVLPTFRRAYALVDLTAPARRRMTVYQRVGDAFAIATGGLALAFGLIAASRRQR